MIYIYIYFNIEKFFEHTRCSYYFISNCMSTDILAPVFIHVNYYLIFKDEEWKI